MIAPPKEQTQRKGQRSPSCGCDKATRSRSAWVRVTIGVVVVSALAVLAVKWWMGNDENAGDEKPIPQERRVKPITVSPPKSTTETVTAEQPQPTVDDNKRYENGVEVLSSTITTNANGITVERLVLANGKTKKKVRHPKPIFEFSSDDLIATAISVKPGESMPPLPINRNIDNEFAQSLLSPIRISDDDSDEVKEIKAKVMETRAYLAEEIKRGNSVYQALMDHQAEVNRVADTRLMAIQELQKVRDEMGDEAAEEFKERINESFKARGIPEIGKRPTIETEKEMP